MSIFKSDTIFAPASAFGGGVAVLRLSGALSKTVFIKLTGIENIQPRHAYFCELKQDDKILDQAVALYFAGPNSFTGEDVVEFHLHGGRAVMDRVMAAIRAIDPTIRLAEAGEFSKRAVQNGKLDLTEAEAIADLVAAETEAQAEQAVAQLGGALKNLYEDWRAQLVHLLSRFEAAIDFVDEEDVPDDVLRDTEDKITAMLQQIDAHLNDHRLGERLRDGFTVAVIGAPNAGKSSLVNALAKRDVAIVSNIAGTTRDAIEVHLNLNGYPVTLIDTAGLRDTNDEIERIGIQRARDRLAQADIVLALFDATAKQDAATLSHVDDKTIVVMTKSDLSPFVMSNVSETSPGDFSPSARNDKIKISINTQQGLDVLLQTLTQKIATLTTRNSNTPLLTRARHRDAVMETRDHLQRAQEKNKGNDTPELLAEDLRLATRALGRLTGRVDVEDLLDVIFSEFCIGK